ncbi:hypothetical protein ACIBEJ_46025 [Nonomuraea sp. NPDC050790]|uniref:nSTAND1 domain-containing NTPase n=1 Tax=Nonomuraea sp. NPDC050790 TaxID=3364371 RepID=UPI0037B6365C
MDDRLGGYWLGIRLGGRTVEAYDESGLRRALTQCVPPEETEPLLRVKSLHVAAVVEVADTFLVSEYVEGRSLRQVVETRGPCSADDLYRLAAATATALAAIHEAGAVHGALDPGAVLLTDAGPRLVGLGTGETDSPWDDRPWDDRPGDDGPRGDSPRDDGPRADGPWADGPWDEGPRDEGPRDDSSRGGGVAGDVRAWGRTLAFAAGGMAELDPALADLVTAALHPDPEHRPGARHLLMSLLDQPQSQQGRLLPPEPVDDPPLGTRAEQLYAALSRAEQELVPEVLLRLVGMDERGEDSRVRVERAELVAGRTPEQAAAIERVLQVYGEAGLLTRDGTNVAMACGALLRAWPRLHEWLDAERDGLAVHRELARAARRWESGGRREADLFHDGTLDRALAWAATGRRHVTLGGEEQAFLDAGLASGRRRGRRRWVVAAAVAVAVLAVAIWQYGTAQGKVDEAMARVAATRAEAARPSDPVLARKLSLTSWALAPVPEALRQLAKSETDPVNGSFTDPTATERSLHTLSADGRKLAALTDGVLRIFDTATGEQIARTPGPPEKIRAIAWSPVERDLALVGIQRTYFWDTTSGGGVKERFARGLSQPGRHAAWFSPGGTFLFAEGSEYGERWAWDLGQGEEAFAGRFVVVGPDDRRVLEFDGRRSLIDDLRTGQVSPAPWLERMPPDYTAFSPDGGRVAIAGEDGVQLYDLTGVPTLSTPLQPASGTLRFSPDGRYLAGTDSDRVRVWQVAGGTLTVDRQVPLAGGDRPVQAVFDPSSAGIKVLAGRGTVLSIAADGTRRATPADRSAEAICAGWGGLTRAEWARHLPELPYRDLCHPTPTTPN